MPSEIIGTEIDPEKPPTTHVFRRQFVACLNCRQKKIKCHMQEDLKRCVRCVRQNLDCMIPPRKQYVWKQKGDAKRKQNKVNKPLLEGDYTFNETQQQQGYTLVDEKIKNYITPMTGTESILQGNASNLRAEQSLLSIGSRPNEPIREQNDGINKKETETANPPDPQITTTHGALAFLTNAANNSENLNKKQSRIDQSKITDRKLEPFGYWELDMSIQDNQFHNSTGLNGAEESEDVVYGKIIEHLPFLNNILDYQKIENLVELFFLTQHPFYPFLPTHLKSLRQLYRFPLLLLTVLTISTRYQSGTDASYEKIHISLWNNCQQMLSKTIWASVDSFGSLGTIFAFLLFTEWNPRSIHSKVGDYASISNENSTSKEFESLKRSENLSFMLSGSAIRLANSMNIATKTGNLLLALQITELNVTMNFNLNNNLNILRIDNKNINHFNKEYNNELEIAKKYVLKGNQQTLERWKIFTKNFQNQESISQSLLINFWQDEKLLYYKHKSVFNSGISGYSNRSYTSSNSNLNKRNLFLDKWQRAEIKMLEMIKLSYETLYYSSITNNYEEPFYSNPSSFNSISTHSLDMNDCINFLKFLQIIINNWYEQFEDLLKPIDPEKDKLVVSSTNLKDAQYVLRQTELRRGEWFIIDFHYCKIYGFAIVLEFFHKKKNIILHHSNMQLIEYLKDCYISCQYIHDSCLRLMKANLLPYLPIRLIGKIIRSIAFLVKMYIYLQQFKKFKILESKKLLLNLRFVKIEDVLVMVKNLSDCLKETAPDTSHLGLHYSKILRFLYEKIAKKENIDFSDDEDIKTNPANVNNEKDILDSRPEKIHDSARDDMFDILFNNQDLVTSRFSAFATENGAAGGFASTKNSAPIFSSDNTANSSEFPKQDRSINEIVDDYNVIDEILGLNYESPLNSLTRPNSAVLSQFSPSANAAEEAYGTKHGHVGVQHGASNNIISSVSIFDVFGDII